MIMQKNIEDAFLRLVKYVEEEGFYGYDPYDALNSPILSLLGKPSKLFRIAFTQALRRSIINFRPLIAIGKSHTPKGMGLFLSSYINLYKIYKDESYLDNIEFLADWLINNYSNGYSGYCWGYNFDWQNRTFFAPKGTPNIVNTSFIGHALLDTFECLGLEKYLEVAQSACNFILQDLNTHCEGDAACFSYTPLDNSKVYNANYLGASLLIRTYSYTKNEELLINANKAYEYGNKNQMQDGSWFYGSSESQRWIDSFHTGYNIDALHCYEKSIGENKFGTHIKKGLDFYIKNFFLDDGTPKYYHNSIYPIDIHCPAQALVTLSKLKDYDDRAISISEKVLNWTIKNMQDPKGFFYFRKGKLLTNKIPYMRWGQAWMLYGLSNLLYCHNEER